MRVSLVKLLAYLSSSYVRSLSVGRPFLFFRVKENLIYTVTETLDFSMPDSTISFFDSIRDELMHYENDKSKATYRLVRFTVNKENYFILTNRRDLTTFQIIMLYAYRWQIELFFPFLKRSMGGIHLIRHDKQGTAIQFYTMMTLALLQLHLKQEIMDKFEEDENESEEEKPVENDNGKRERNIQDSKKPHILKEGKDNSRLGDAGFLASLGGVVKKYWKIGVHWLAALGQSGLKVVEIII